MKMEVKLESAIGKTMESMESRAFDGIVVRAGMFALWNLTSTKNRDQVYRSFCAAMQSALDAKDFETASAFRDLREMLTENHMPERQHVHKTHCCELV